MKRTCSWLVLVGLVVATSAASGASPAAIQGKTATLGPDNTKIEFVGVHSGAKPDPRTGGFAKFKGQAEVDPAAKTLQAVTLEIATDSLFTEIPKLTNHLKSGDFFECREYPTAKFESTKIEAAGGKHKITGKLTLHGVTKEISFPATVEIGAHGLQLTSEFKIDRSQFGMTYGAGQVENEVSLAVVVGEKTVPK
ncbi:MAG: YceI family protein [Pirellulaceae bacterium]